MLGEYHNDIMPLAENPQATIHGRLSLWSHLNGNFLTDTRTKIADYNMLQMGERHRHTRQEKQQRLRRGDDMSARSGLGDICALKGTYLAALEGSTGRLEWSGEHMFIQCYTPPCMRCFTVVSSTGGPTRGGEAQSEEC